MRKRVFRRIFLVGLALLPAWQVFGMSSGIHGVPGREIPVLLFHEVAKDCEPGRCLDPSRFTEMMDYLKLRKFQALSLDDYREIRAGRKRAPRRPVVITFDDGEQSVYSVSYPILKDRGFPAAVFLVSGFVGRTLYHVLEERSYWDRRPPDGRGTVWKFDMIDWDEARQMARDGISFYAHSASHAPLVSLDADFLAEEVASPKRTIERETGRPVRYFAYPWGEFNEAVVASLKEAGYEAAFTTEFETWPGAGNERFALKRYEITPHTRDRDFKIIVWGLMPLKEKLVRGLKTAGLYGPLRRMAGAGAAAAGKAGFHE